MIATCKIVSCISFLGIGKWLFIAIDDGESFHYVDFGAWRRFSAKQVAPSKAIHDHVD